MNCEQAAEFVSALCDGQQIPRDAAEHIGTCETCRALLHEYTVVGAELRRVASLASAGAPSEARWSAAKQVIPHWWQRGWESMRIPKFAFALLLVAIVLLASGLAAVKAQQRTKGSVLILTIKSSGGQTTKCALPTEYGNLGGCFVMHLRKVSEPNGRVGRGLLNSHFRVIAKDGNRFQIGVRAGFTNQSPLADGKSYKFSPLAVETLSEKTYWFEPGERLAIEVANMGNIEVTGEALDHMPSMVSSEGSGVEPLDPREGELRVISPVLLKGSSRVVDLEGFHSDSVGGIGVFIYVPGEGRFVLSPSPMAGAVEGDVRINRISFGSAGNSYIFLMAAPITRSDHIWVLHERSYKPPDAPDDRPLAGSMEPIQSTPVH